MSLYDGQAKRVALLPPAWDSAETPTKEPILIDGVEIGAVLRNVLSHGPSTVPTSPFVTLLCSIRDRTRSPLTLRNSSSRQSARHSAFSPARRAVAEHRAARDRSGATCSCLSGRRTERTLVSSVAVAALVCARKTAKSSASSTYASTDVGAYTREGSVY